MATIKDIAKRCGVSTATVSKALNGYEDISEATIAKVLKAAEELHYMPNSAARQLKTNSSHNIGVLFVDDSHSGLSHEYFASILNGAKDEAERLGYDITFISQNIGGRPMSFLEHAVYRKCDGVLIACVDFKSPAVIQLVCLATSLALRKEPGGSHSLPLSYLQPCQTQPGTGNPTSGIPEA